MSNRRSDVERQANEGAGHFRDMSQQSSLIVNFSATRVANRHAAISSALGCLACMQSAACWALLAAVKMARGSCLRMRNHDATYAAWSDLG